MSIMGIGLHILIAIFFAIHAVRSGQQLFWLFILFSFPLLGSVVYFVVVYLPDSRLQRGTRKAVSVASKVLDPNRELREARAAFDYTPTAANQMRLANALLAAGQAEDAANNFEASLSGLFANDPDIRWGAARARFQAGQPATALPHLATLRSDAPDYKPEAVALLQAQAFAAAGQAEEAKRAFESTLQRFGSFEVKAEYFIWAVNSGETTLAAAIRPDITSTTQRWTRHTRDLNRELLKRLDQAMARTA